MPARVLIADNYYVFAIGAARTLKKSPVTKGVQTVIVGDIRHAEFRLSQERFDVVLISDSLLPVPELNLKALMKAQPIMIGVVYDTLDPVQVAECYRSGVSAILSRRISPDDLCDSLAAELIQYLSGGDAINKAECGDPFIQENLYLIFETNRFIREIGGLGASDTFNMLCKRSQAAIKSFLRRGGGSFVFQ